MLLFIEICFAFLVSLGLTREWGFSWVQSIGVSTVICLAVVRTLHLPSVLKAWRALEVDFAVKGKEVRALRRKSPYSISGWGVIGKTSILCRVSVSRAGILIEKSPSLVGLLSLSAVLIPWDRVEKLIIRTRTPTHHRDEATLTAEILTGGAFIRRIKILWAPSLDSKVPPSVLRDDSTGGDLSRHQIWS